MDSHVPVWPFDLGIRTPALWRGPFSWGDGLPSFGVALGVEDIDSHASVRLRELLIRTPMPCCGPLRWGDGVPCFGVAFSVGLMDFHASVWPFELRIRTPGGANRVNFSTVFTLHCFLLTCVPNMMQGVGELDFTRVYSTIVYFTFLFPTLPCSVLTYSSKNHKMFSKYRWWAVGELPIASLGTGLQHAFGAI